jgi:hypothetical protein
MSLLEKYHASSKNNAMKILDGAIGKLEKMEATFGECFPYPGLSAASADFKTMNVESGTNEKVSKAVSTAMDEIFSVSRGS